MVPRLPSKFLLDVFFLRTVSAEENRSRSPSFFGSVIDGLRAALNPSVTRGVRDLLRFCAGFPVDVRTRTKNHRAEAVRDSLQSVCRGDGIDKGPSRQALPVVAGIQEAR